MSRKGGFENVIARDILAKRSDRVCFFKMAVCFKDWKSSIRIVDRVLVSLPSNVTFHRLDC